MGLSRWHDSLPNIVTENMWDIVKFNWMLGFTSFGGPPVHFKIFHDKFVDKLHWISEELYQELFSISQALSGPGSTKMLYCINLIHCGFLSAVLGFFIWSLPGALGMYGLSIGVSNIGETLPEQVYALLSGLNAATVGIIALAAVELSEKTITDEVTRALVFLGAAAGMLYNALWYYPVLMLIAGLVTIIHDYRWLHGPIKATISFFRTKTKRHVSGTESIELPDRNTEAGHGQEQRPGSDHRLNDHTESETNSNERRVIPHEHQLNFSWKVGAIIIGSFLASFIVIMVLRGVLLNPPLLYRLFANMFLAGTIIFGGGPVVIRLLREYVVAEGWVSARDFLIGLAIIQAFPGPNFNFAVFLGSLTAINGDLSSAGGAILGFTGIFAPGLILVHGTMGVWSALRGNRWFKSGLRGINAGAVGLIFTAVYRLWTIGYIDRGFQSGISLSSDPWWVVVTATSYVGGRWYKVKPPVAIILGAVMGLIRYGVVSS